MKLTAKQEKFAFLVASGKTQSDAYREAYDAENMTDKQVWEESSKLCSDPKVSQRLDTLREEAAKRNEVTLDEIVGMIREAYRVASEKKDSSNIRGSAVDLAKVTGNIVEKREISGKDGDPLTVKLVNYSDE